MLQLASAFPSSSYHPLSSDILCLFCIRLFFTRPSALGLPPPCTIVLSLVPGQAMADRGGGGGGGGGTALPVGGQGISCATGRTGPAGRSRRGGGRDEEPCLARGCRLHVHRAPAQRRGEPAAPRGPARPSTAPRSRQPSTYESRRAAVAAPSPSGREGGRAAAASPRAIDCRSELGERRFRRPKHADAVIRSTGRCQTADLADTWATQRDFMTYLLVIRSCCVVRCLGCYATFRMVLDH